MVEEHKQRQDFQPVRQHPQDEHAFNKIWKGDHLIDGEAVRALEVAIHPSVIGAIHLEEDAFLTPHLFVQGLAQAAGSKGAVLLPQTEVLNFNLQKDRISAVLAGPVIYSLEPAIRHWGSHWFLSSASFWQSWCWGSSCLCLSVHFKSSVSAEYRPFLQTAVYQKYLNQN
jgi:hypothetical protein